MMIRTGVLSETKYLLTVRPDKRIGLGDVPRLCRVHDPLECFVQLVRKGTGSSAAPHVGDLFVDACDQFIDLVVAKILGFDHVQLRLDFIGRQVVLVGDEIIKLCSGGSHLLFMYLLRIGIGRFHFLCGLDDQVIQFRVIKILVDGFVDEFLLVLERQVRSACNDLGKLLLVHLDLRLAFLLGHLAGVLVAALCSYSNKRCENDDQQCLPADASHFTDDLGHMIWDFRIRVLVLILDS